MKQYIILIIFSLSLFAQESIEQNKLTKIQKVSESTIATLISQIKEAKSDDRRVLMNQLKVKLREMNKESRQKTMRELKNSFSKDGSKKGKKRYRYRKHRNFQYQQIHQPKFRQIGRGQRGGQR